MTSDWKELPLPEGWRWLPVSEFAEVVGGGTPSTKVDSYFGGEIPWLRPSDLTDHEYRWISRGRTNLTQEGLDNSSAKLLPRRTLLFTSRATIGLVALAANPIATNQGFRSLICNEEIADPEFMYYALKQWTPIIESVASGATFKEVSGGALEKVELPLPPIGTQREIASILGAYANLVENNLRRIEILEEMARLIYREWFVHFRFPGDEEVEMVDSELGPIPGGWEVKKLEDTCELVVGQSPKSEFYNEESRGLPFHQGVSDFGDRFPTHHRYCTVTKRVAKPNDILFSVRAPVGRINVADRELVVGRGLHAIRSERGCQEFIYQQLKARFHEEDMMGGGTIFKSVTKRDMLGLDLLFPPSELVDMFESLVSPMIELVGVLTKMEASLTKARDLLIPTLVTGSIKLGKDERREPITS